jgi:hypothetical protein
MTRGKTTRNLFTPKLRGGVIGGTGYNFQDAYILTALPDWLAGGTFHSFVKEGFDDLDVRFGNGPDISTWHYQLKDHPVAVSEFRHVLPGFQAAARRPELNVERLILGCSGLAPKLASLWKMTKEFRGARLAHSDAALGATRNHLLAQIAKLKLTAWADLIIDQIVIDHENPWLSDTEPQALMQRFRGKFITLPLYHQEEPAVLDRLFTSLALRINKAIRRGLHRDEILDIIKEELAGASKGRATVVYLHGWIRQRYGIPADVEIDWTEHFDHTTLRVAPREIWQARLLPALHGLRQRFDGEDHRRLISLRARAPLSAGLAFGHTFAEAAGYSIIVEQPSPGAAGSIQYWRTDSPAVSLEPLERSEIENEAVSDEVVVAIGITDDPRPKVERYLVGAGLTVRASLYLYPPGGAGPTSVSDHTAAALGAALKREIRRFADRHAARVVHLFYYGPLGLAVLLGQKLNGLPDVQCYERDKADGYTPSCRLPA